MRHSRRHRTPAGRTGGSLAGTGGPLAGTVGPLVGKGGPLAGTGGPLAGTGGPPAGIGGPPAGTGGTLDGTEGPLAGQEALLLCWHAPLPCRTSPHCWSGRTNAQRCMVPALGARGFSSVKILLPIDGSGVWGDTENNAMGGEWPIRYLIRDNAKQGSQNSMIPMPPKPNAQCCAYQ